MENLAARISAFLVDVSPNKPYSSIMATGSSMQDASAARGISASCGSGGWGFVLAALSTPAHPGGWRWQALAIWKLGGVGRVTKVGWGS